MESPWRAGGGRGQTELRLRSQGGLLFDGLLLSSVLLLPSSQVQDRTAYTRKYSQPPNCFQNTLRIRIKVHAASYTSPPLLRDYKNAPGNGGVTPLLDSPPSGPTIPSGAGEWLLNCPPGPCTEIVGGAWYAFKEELEAPAVWK